jgi:uncharacterized membrane protein YhaH (DUF805 family)
MNIDWKDLFLSFEGRIGRTHFWIGFALLFGVSFLLQFIPVIGQLVGLLLLWPQVAIHAKRLHDFGRTALLMLVPFVVTIVCIVAAAVTGGAAIFAAMRQNNNDALAQGAAGAGLLIIFLVLPFLVALGFLLWVGLTRSDPGENRYGPPPAVP